MPDPQMTSSDFAAKIKAKYPDYANIPDTELVAKMITKYPEYRDKVSFAAPEARTPQELAAQAMRASGVPVGGQVAPIAPKVDMQEQGGVGAAMGAYANNVSDNVSNAGRVYKAFGQDVSGAMQGIGHLAKAALTDPTGNPSYGLAKAMVTPIVESANDKTQSKAETMGAAFGVNSPAIKQAALNEDYPSIIGHSILPVGLAALGGRVVKEVMPSASDLGIPTKAHAGENFSAAMKKAGDVPVDTSSAMEPAARMKELNDAGSYLPPVIKKFIKRITDPEQPPLTYKEARDFYSNAGDLSVTQRLKTNRKINSQLHDFIGNLGESIQDTANNAGVGEEHAAAMAEYAKVMRLNGVKESIIKQVLKPLVKAVPYGAGVATGGALSYGAYKAVTR